ncbi:MAG: alpha/beta hydrolase [Gammaproteobacteria bacterium]|nr:alpha/beta hydrolase [Gammaproteobacteria bacterium]
MSLQTNQLRVSRGACYLNVETYGQRHRPAIVLVHGLGMQLVEWPTDLIHALQQNFYVITMDNRDIGLSSRHGPDIDLKAGQASSSQTNYRPPYSLFDMRDDIIAVVNHLQIRRFACVGFSMGGMLAQLVAAYAPERVLALVQIGSTGSEADLGSSKECQQRLQRITQSNNCQTELVQMMVEDFAYYARPMHLDAKATLEESQLLIARGYTQGGYTRQWQALQSLGNRLAILQQIQAPTLIIAGVEDPCIDPSHSLNAHSIITNSELLMLPNVGHWLSEAICQAAINWLTQKLSGWADEPAP